MFVSTSNQLSNDFVCTLYITAVTGHEMIENIDNMKKGKTVNKSFQLPIIMLILLKYCVIDKLVVLLYHLKHP